MKKLLFSMAAFAGSLAFGQITLEHTFPSTEQAGIYSNETELYYYTQIDNNPSIKIYNSDFVLLKTVNTTIPAGYSRMNLYRDNDFDVSKHIFNADNKLEFLVYFSGNSPVSKVRIINEDGEIIKDFPGTYYLEDAVIYHDPIDNINKIKLYNEGTGNTEIYALPTSVLANKEITSTLKNKLTAFPIPAKTTLKITNPKNGNNKVSVFDTTGKLVLSQTFSSQEDLVSLNVENLAKGLYIYNIGEQGSKFIKE